MKNSTILTFASQKVHPSIEPDVSCSCFLLAFCAWAYPQLSEGPRALQCRPQIKGCCINIIVLPTLTIGICMPLWSCCGDYLEAFRVKNSVSIYPAAGLMFMFFTCLFCFGIPPTKGPGTLHCRPQSKGRLLHQSHAATLRMGICVLVAIVVQQRHLMF